MPASLRWIKSVKFPLISFGDALGPHDDYRTKHDALRCSAQQFVASPFGRSCGRSLQSLRELTRPQRHLDFGDNAPRRRSAHTGCVGVIHRPRETESYRSNMLQDNAPRAKKSSMERRGKGPTYITIPCFIRPRPKTNTSHPVFPSSGFTPRKKNTNASETLGARNSKEVDHSLNRCRKP